MIVEAVLDAARSCFDTTNMTITISKAKVTDIAELVADWHGCTHANLHALSALLGKLFYICQCCIPARFFLNSMLEMLRSCPPTGDMALSSDFRKDIH